MRTFRIGGIHPAECKLTRERAIKAFSYEGALSVVLGQSIGKPAKAVVKPGETVAEGQLIAAADGMLSANVHSPVNGKVKKLDRVHTPQGYWADAIIIEPSGAEDEVAAIEHRTRTRREVMSMTPEEIIAAVREAGVVGLGGATFPTDVKLRVPQGMHAECVIINGAECEPYLTCDDRLMREQERKVALGAEVLMRAVGVSRGVVAIEENKPEAIASMRKAVAEVDGLHVEVLKKKYPQGGEKQLIAAVTGREVPGGALPVAVGAIVDNVATAVAVYDALYSGKPLTGRVVTVTGDISGGGNYLVPLGVPVRELLDRVGVTITDDMKVIAGGPMMGRAVSSLDAPTTKGLSGLTVLYGDTRRQEEPCIRCGACMNACPMGLEPYLFIALARRGRWADMRSAQVMNCIECGSCSYICPASKPLLDFIKLGKGEVRKLK